MHVGTVEQRVRAFDKRFIGALAYCRVDEHGSDENPVFAETAREFN